MTRSRTMPVLKARRPNDAVPLPTDPQEIAYNYLYEAIYAVFNTGDEVHVEAADPKAIPLAQIPSAAVSFRFMRRFISFAELIADRPERARETHRIMLKSDLIPSDERVFFLFVSGLIFTVGYFDGDEAWMHPVTRHVFFNQNVLILQEAKAHGIELVVIWEGKMYPVPNTAVLLQRSSCEPPLSGQLSLMIVR